MDIAGAVALVTGGLSGLGLATSRRLAAGGADVVIVDRPSLAGDTVAADIGGKFVPSDVSSDDDVARAVGVAVDRGVLRLVVNCAGIGPAARVVGSKGMFPLDVYIRTLEVNLVGTFNVTRHAAAAMIATPQEGEERGVIVNTASVAAFDGQIGQTAYSASKGGIVGMTLPLARDLAEHRIRVNTIAPGSFRTPLFDSLSQKSIDSLTSQIPHPKRLGRPEEFADLVESIVRNPMLNGETIRLDGAMRMGSR